nr:MAG TPA: hypothetical protein [Caudoviricetes sp.]
MTRSSTKNYFVFAASQAARTISSPVGVLRIFRNSSISDSE